MGGSLIEWAVASAQAEHELESGDASVVIEGGTRALVAVIDALGHGPEAAATARQARTALLQAAGLEPAAMLQRCHQQLLRSRGAAISLCAFDGEEGALTWVGVGNVEGLLVRVTPEGTSVRESLLTRGGVVGYQLPALRPATLRIQRGDLLLLATDGIRVGLGERVSVLETPRQNADRLFAWGRLPKDDALLLVARYAGRRS